MFSEFKWHLLSFSMAVCLLGKIYYTVSNLSCRRTSLENCMKSWSKSAQTKTPSSGWTIYSVLYPSKMMADEAKQNQEIMPKWIFKMSFRHQPGMYFQNSIITVDGWIVWHNLESLTAYCNHIESTTVCYAHNISVHPRSDPPNIFGGVSFCWP